MKIRKDVGFVVCEGPQVNLFTTTKYTKYTKENLFLVCFFRGFLPYALRAVPGAGSGFAFAEEV